MELITISSPTQLTDVIQSLVTGSFEKKFGGMKTDDVVSGFAFATVGLSQEQLQTGLMSVLDNGYCPDPALFRRWCLGLKGFDNSNAIADSYIGKHGALANIIKWIESDGKTSITNAQKQAYDETYHLWQGVDTKTDQNKAEMAFKDVYEHIVNKLVADKKPCEIYQAPLAINQAPKQDVKHDALDNERAKQALAQAQEILRRRAA